ncbi:hypothetical protein [Streptomyces sp. NPDC000880]
MRRRACRSGAVLLALVLPALLLTACPAAAEQSEPAPAPAAAEPPDRARAIAEHLARDPLYVDPARIALLKPPVQRKIRERIGTSEVPIYVVVTSYNHDPTDPYEGDPGILLAFVHDRLRRDGVYVVADEDGDDLVAQEYGVERDAETATLIGEYTDPLRVSLPRFVDVVASGTAEERYEKENGWGDGTRDRKGTWWTALGVVGVIIVVGLGLSAYAIRRSQRGGGSRPRFR